MELQNAVALVTGGGTGIGRATALALARRGAAVAVNYSRSQAEAEQTVAEIVALGGRALAVRADVSRDAEVRAMVERVVAELGGLDLLVNNAGTTRYIPLGDLEAVMDEDWERIFAVNVRGIFYCSRAAAPHMKERGRGAIVNTGSVGGLLGDGSSLPYAVSKAAVVGLTKALARALAPEIRVCSVAPGIVETRWVAGREEHVRRLSEDTLLHHNASPDDVAAMICALLEQDAMTGQTLVIDGGLLL